MEKENETPTQKYNRHIKWQIFLIFGFQFLRLFPNSIVQLTLFKFHSSSTLQSECISIWLGGSLWETESGTISSMSMRSSWVLLMTSHISNVWFRSGLKIETTCGWHSVWVMFRNMSWLFWWNVGFLWD